MKYLRILVLAITLSVGFAPSVGWSADQFKEESLWIRLPERMFCKFILRGELFARTELFFGLSKPVGAVSPDEFQDFVDKKVTPRFPDGLTVIDAKGQFRGASEVVVKEDARVLILLYAYDPKSSRSIEEIRAEYKEMFEQQSVLRVDERSCVSF